MVQVAAAANEFLRTNLAEWRSVRLAELMFSRGDAALLMLVVFLAVSLGVLMARSMFRGRTVKGRVALPALVPGLGGASFSFVRHSPLLLFLAGLPFFAVAVADPFTSFAHKDVTYPGRRIALMVDASSSMMDTFDAPRLAQQAPNRAKFFTAVGAVQTFVKTRMQGKFKDLIALLEFGDESYVVTPFTNDYDNILLSVSLIGEPNEFYRFPDQGTTIGAAMDLAVNLFTAFDFLNAAGNLLIIVSDGEDQKVDGPKLNNKTVEEILSGVTKAKIPVYFIRLAQNYEYGKALSDSIWGPVVERTGGKFYAAKDEATILAAIQEIDKRATGSVSVKQYSTQQVRFTSFALAAFACWTLALALKLTVPHLRKFP